METLLQQGTNYEIYVRDIIKEKYKECWIWKDIPNEILLELEFIKDIKAEIKRLDIDNKHLTTYGKIYINNEKHKKLHPQMVMIDESGIYIVLNNSTKTLAKDFRNKLISFI